MQNKFYNFTRFSLILLNDFLLVSSSLYFSYILRIEYFINPFSILFVFFVSNFLYIFFFFFLKIHKQYFRYFTFNNSKTYFSFFILYTLTFGIYVLFQNDQFIPRSLIIIFPIILFLLILINRFLISNFFNYKLKISKKTAIVFGFNSSNKDLITQYAKIKFFIDNNIKNKKRIYNGIKIISSEEFDKIFKTINFEIILISDLKIFHKSRHNIRDFIIKKGILVQNIDIKNNEILTTPYLDFNYFFNKKNKQSPIGNIYDNKTILVTGAGGSIGSNIALQLSKTNFKKLILLDNSEFNLYSIARLVKNSNVEFSLNSFNDNGYISELFNKNKIDVIFHAAAYKHVPLIEQNQFSAIKNNFFYTFDFIKKIIEKKIPYFCLISSDKAVRPTNIMGASKRLAELTLLYFNNSKKNNKTSLNCVRFGNVVNSSGSVMPLFKSQIENNQSVTVTHKDIIRYFMTIEEAANLVLNTFKVSNEGEIFLLDMGEPIKLFDLAKLMIQFSGKTLKNSSSSNGDIQIKIIGLRKGEKLYEELLIDDLSKPTKIKNIFQSIESAIPQLEFENIYKNILKAYNDNDTSYLIEILKNKFIGYVE